MSHELSLGLWKRSPEGVRNYFSKGIPDLASRVARRTFVRSRLFFFTYRYEIDVWASQADAKGESAKSDPQFQPVTRVPVRRNFSWIKKLIRDCRCRAER